MLSNGISAPSGLQASQDSISRSASRNVAALTSSTLCCSGVGSKKSRDIRRGFYHCVLVIDSNWTDFLHFYGLPRIVLGGRRNAKTTPPPLRLKNFSPKTLLNGCLLLVGRLGIGVSFFGCTGRKGCK